MSADVPILNEYKKSFIRERLVQTFLGGIRLSPWYMSLIQLPFYVFPLGLYYLILEFGPQTRMKKRIVFSVGIFGYFIGVGTVSYILGKRPRYFTDQDEKEIVAIPRKKHKINIVIHGLITAAFAFAVFDIFVSDDTVIVVFSWFTTLSAIFSCLSGSFPETAMYRALDVYEISSVSRPIHGILSSIPFYFESTKPFRIVYALLPLFWILGALPTVEPLIFWFIERLQISAFGGTASATKIRAAIQLLFSLAEFAVVFEISRKNYDNRYYVFAASAIIGYVLSVDSVGVVIDTWKRRIWCKKATVDAHENHLTTTAAKKKTKKFRIISTSRESCSVIKETGIHFLFFIITAIIAMTVTETKRNSNLYRILSWINVLLLLLLVLGRTLFRRIYFFFDWFRNPLYPSVLYSEDGRHPLFATICFHFMNLLLNHLLPSYLLFYVALCTNRPYEYSWMDVIATIRITRWIWQRSVFALTDAVLFYVYDATYSTFFSTIPILNRIRDVSDPAKFLIFSFLRQVLIGIWRKMYFVSALSISSLENRASKRSYAGCLFQMNILLSPAIALIITVSSILSAPLFAFFSLPIFSVAFPRPQRFWPESDQEEGAGLDSIYYRQMIPSLMKSRSYKSSITSLNPGDHLLIRHEDRILWITILEGGNGYLYYKVKGTELQEASCHSLEATRIDEIFHDAFSNRTNPSYCNRYAFHNLTPINRFRVMTYSDTKNVLTGVIEHEETLRIIAKIFLKTLAWFLFRTLTKFETLLNEEVKSENQVPFRSESIEAVHLDSWPNSTTTSEITEETSKKWADQRQRFAYCQSSESDLEDDDSESGKLEINLSNSRRSRLPPLEKRWSNSMESLSNQLENIFLPGGLAPPGNDKVKKQKVTETIITPTPTLKSVSMKDDRKRKEWKYYPPTDWFHFPRLTSIRTSEISMAISDDWMSFAFKRIFREHLSGNSEMEQILSKLDTDWNLREQYRRVISGCYALIYSSESDVTAMGPDLPVKIFQTDDRISSTLPEILSTEVVRPAIKTAVKIALDQVILAENISDSNANLSNAIIDLETNWFLGTDSTPEWNRAIMKNVPKLFSLNKVTDNGSSVVYRSRILDLRPCEVFLGQLNSEVVHGLWASLNLELLYLTNDDDERYSIQAEERLLRNLTVQVADPPLGYPVYTSKPIRQGLE